MRKIITADEMARILDAIEARLAQVRPLTDKDRAMLAKLRSCGAVAVGGPVEQAVRRFKVQYGIN